MLRILSCGGLSPRMRGNHDATGELRDRDGSIPAHAGEPPRSILASTSPRVYPRACGGTSQQIALDLQRAGLSPRMRGNPTAGPARCSRRGSIPAHAGEPRSSRRSRICGWVYPRACGGTDGDMRQGGGHLGLSPRMRGNRPSSPGCCACCGSIPAHAGEPLRSEQGPDGKRVYPRACGGTPGGRVDGVRVSGLSPRMRGNRVPIHLLPLPVGSIPAHAGEPRVSWALNVRSRVYPRACGGTTPRSTRTRSSWGLSPRMRGNHRHGLGHPAHHGSIPAHAGEPPTS